MNDDELVPFDWGGLVPLYVHAAQISIIEAMRRLGFAVSAVEVTRSLYEPKWSLSLIVYHFEQLENKKVITPRGSAKVRGANQTFYFLRDKPTNRVVSERLDEGKPR